MNTTPRDHFQIVFGEIGQCIYIPVSQIHTINDLINFIDPENKENKDIVILDQNGKRITTLENLTEKTLFVFLGESVRDLVLRNQWKELEWTSDPEFYFDKYQKDESEQSKLEAQLNYLHYIQEKKNSHRNVFQDISEQFENGFISVRNLVRQFQTRCDSVHDRMRNLKSRAKGLKIQDEDLEETLKSFQEETLTIKQFLASLDLLEASKSVESEMKTSSEEIRKLYNELGALKKEFSSDHSVSELNDKWKTKHSYPITKTSRDITAASNHIDEAYEKTKNDCHTLISECNQLNEKNDSDIAFFYARYNDFSERCKNVNLDIYSWCKTIERKIDKLREKICHLANSSSNNETPKKPLLTLSSVCFQVRKYQERLTHIEDRFHRYSEQVEQYELVSSLHDMFQYIEKESQRRTEWESKMSFDVDKINEEYDSKCQKEREERKRVLQDSSQHWEKIQEIPELAAFFIQSMKSYQTRRPHSIEPSFNALLQSINLPHIKNGLEIMFQDLPTEPPSKNNISQCEMASLSRDSYIRQNSKFFNYDNNNNNNNERNEEKEISQSSSTNDSNNEEDEEEWEEWEVTENNEDKEKYEGEDDQHCSSYSIECFEESSSSMSSTLSSDIRTLSSHSMQFSYAGKLEEQDHIIKELQNKLSQKDEYIQSLQSQFEHRISENQSQRSNQEQQIESLSNTKQFQDEKIQQLESQLIELRNEKSKLIEENEIITRETSQVEHLKKTNEQLNHELNSIRKESDELRSNLERYKASEEAEDSAWGSIHGFIEESLSHWGLMTDNKDSMEMNRSSNGNKIQEVNSPLNHAELFEVKLRKLLNHFQKLTDEYNQEKKRLLNDKNDLESALLNEKGKKDHEKSSIRKEFESQLEKKKKEIQQFIQEMSSKDEELKTSYAKITELRNDFRSNSKNAQKILENKDKELSRLKKQYERVLQQHQEKEVKIQEQYRKINQLQEKQDQNKQSYEKKLIQKSEETKKLQERVSIAENAQMTLQNQLTENQETVVNRLEQEIRQLNSLLHEWRSYAQHLEVKLSRWESSCKQLEHVLQEKHTTIERYKMELHNLYEIQKKQKSSENSEIEILNIFKILRNELDLHHILTNEEMVNHIITNARNSVKILSDDLPQLGDVLLFVRGGNNDTSFIAVSDSKSTKVELKTQDLDDINEKDVRYVVGQIIFEPEEKFVKNDSKTSNGENEIVYYQVFAQVIKVI